MWNSYYWIIVGTAFASAVSQILLNYSNKRKYSKRIYEYLNPFVILSYFILFIVLALNVYVMQYVGLKEAHAVAATTYIFVLVLGRLFLKEPITKYKAIGITLIMVGVIVFVI